MSLSLPIWLAERAREFPRREALVGDGLRFDWAELADRTRQTALALRDDGLRPGATLAVQLPPGEAFVRGLHAAWWCGARLLPLSTRLTPAERADQLRRAGVGRIHSLDGSELRGGSGISASLENELSAQSDALLVFTSGTSALPKAARLSHANLRCSAEASARHLGASPDDRWLACLPFFHVGGLSILTRSAHCGCAVVVHERFDPVAVSRSLDEEGISHLSLVPTTLKRLLETRTRRAPDSLRVVLLGGAAAPSELVRRAVDRGFPVRATYGLTECASQVATADPANPERLRPLPGTELRIEHGEICVRAPMVFPGYHGDASATRRALRDGWLHTGDVGRIAPDGSLVVADRASDLVITGGENVAPAEVEAVLLAHPDVAEAAVTGLPDADLGQKVTAWVVAREGAALATGGLQAHCRARISGYKVPREIRLVSALPRNAMGKVVRRALGAFHDGGPRSS